MTGFLRGFKFIYVALAIFVGRVLLNIYGFNVVPFASNPDEVIIQDPALFFYRIGQFKALSYYGQLIDVVDSHHPPLFIWLQAFIFHLRGFDLIALRLPSILYSVASLAVVAYSLWLVAAVGLASKRLIKLFIVILFLDPNYLSWSRFGRHDTLANLFMSIAIAMLLISYSNSPIACYNSDIGLVNPGKKVRNTLRPGQMAAVLLASAVFMGLSLSSHLQSIYGYAFYLGYLLLVGRKYIPTSIASLCAVIPIATLIVLWAYAFRDDIPYSLEVFNAIQSKFKGDQDWVRTISSLSVDNRFDARRFSIIGGSLLIFHILAYTAALICAALLVCDKIKLNNKKRPVSPHPSTVSLGVSTSVPIESWLFLGIASLSLQIILIIYKFGLGTSRFYIFYPITIVVTPILLDWIGKHKGVESLALPFTRLFLILIILFNFVLLASYAKLVHSRLATNKYDQVYEAIGSYSGTIKNGLAVPHVFWLAAHQLLPDKNIQVIDNGFVIEQGMDADRRFALIKKQDLDVVVIGRSSALSGPLDDPSSGYRKSEKQLNVLGKSYNVYEKTAAQ